jgi:hypothetical protein
METDYQTRIDALKIIMTRIKLDKDRIMGCWKFLGLMKKYEDTTGP